MRPIPSHSTVTLHPFATAQGGCGLRALLSGRVDHAALPCLTPLLRRVADARALTLCVDLGRVEFLDSCGIGILLALRDAVLDRGGAIAFENHPPRIRRVLERSRIVALTDSPRVVGSVLALSAAA
ncbi:STAS domain-containing protein [Azospirillum formosense]|uniref:STAS domain-containing protein n=1 Tax=Azospirillum formosense TaxID=861533 RepID=A0ABX2L7S7_9PROT|nr:STAS domain-containing protein [Azospirillum formosense]MBY3752652.1 STAS domain-containing protein [Azospirillum formosense]NUB22505.1 STAS domain-containing protein [Azospirillum formosense]